MPCYTVSTATVAFGKNTDPNLLDNAVRLQGMMLGYSVTFNKATGEITYRENSGLDLARLKRDYSEQVVNATAKKNGWRVQWETNKAGNRVAQVERISR